MTHILDITLNDLTQLVRDRKTFMFLLVMPIAFTLLFGFAFGGLNTAPDGPRDDRLPVAVLDQDSSPFSQELVSFLSASSVIRIEAQPDQSPEALYKSVGAGEWVAALVIPAGYGESLPTGQALKLSLVAQPGELAAQTVRSEITTLASRLMSAAHTARLLAADSPENFEPVFHQALSAWNNPPVRVRVHQGQAAVEEEPQAAGPAMNFSHTSPGMIIQFAIAGLLTAAQVLVNERKNRCLPRLLTTATSRVQILFGHYLSISLMLFTQFTLLILFGQVFLGVNYLGQPLATLLVALCSVACLAALGLLIGVVAKSEEQAVTISLVCMFAFAGLGGAWMPLEFTGATFQMVGHVTPVAWAMDGFKNITARGLGIESIWLPALALAAYALAFFILAAWRFRYETGK